MEIQGHLIMSQVTLKPKNVARLTTKHSFSQDCDAVGLQRPIKSYLYRRQYKILMSKTFRTAFTKIHDISILETSRFLIMQKNCHICMMVINLVYSKIVFSFCRQWQRTHFRNCM